MRADERVFRMSEHTCLNVIFIPVFCQKINFFGVCAWAEHMVVDLWRWQPIWAIALLMAPALLGWQMLWAFLQLSGDHHCFLWALLCLVLWSVLLITVCLRQKLPKLSLSLNFEMSCSDDGISSFFCMNGIGYGKVPGKKNHVTKVYLLYILEMKQKAVGGGGSPIICQLCWMLFSKWCSCWVLTFITVVSYYIAHPQPVIYFFTNCPLSFCLPQDLSWHLLSTSSTLKQKAQLSSVEAELFL